MNRGHVQILAAALLYGYIIVGGRVLSNAGLSLIEISALPLGVVALILTLARPALLQSLFSSANIVSFLIFGLIGAALQITQYGGVVLGIPISMVVMLLYLQPAWTILMSRIVLKEPITRRKIVALAIALLGALILLNPVSTSGNYNSFGLLSAVSAGWALAIWVLWSKKLRKKPGISATLSVLGYSLFTFFALILTLLVEHVFFGGILSESIRTEIWIEAGFEILSVAFFAYLIPSFLFFSGIRRIAASVAGLLLMLEPVSATYLAAVWFREPITWNLCLGGALILLADALILIWNSRS